MKLGNNRAVLYKKFVFIHCLEQDVEVRGTLSIKVTLPTDRPELIATVPLEPEQLAGMMLTVLNGNRKEMLTTGS